MRIDCDCITVADEDSIQLPDAITIKGEVFVNGDNERANFFVENNGTVTLDYSGGSVVNTDTDTNLCIIDKGTNAIIKNRLGSSKKICYSLKYAK